MSRPLRVEFPGAVYHVIARGNERRIIFRDPTDRRGYLDRLGRYADRLDFSIYAYCLMTNHVHLALETGRIPLSRIMLALHGSYSQAFNRRHGRVGHLFQGRYKAYLVEGGKHLLALVRYIHLNPLRAGLVLRPQGFEWSSERAYRFGGGPPWLSASVALSCLARTEAASRRAYASFVDGGAGAQYEDLPTYGQLVKGDEEFAVRIAQDREPEIARRGLTADQVGRIVSKAFGLDAEEFRKARSRVRAITGYVGREVAGIPLCRTAIQFRKHETTIVRDVRRLELDMRTDARLCLRVTELLKAAANAGIQR